MALALLALNVFLNLPLFSDGAQPYRGSIESGYAGIGHFFAMHPNPWGWNPYFYCGLPSQFVYLPAVPYASALLEWMHPALTPLHAYRILTASLASLGPVTLFLFAARAGGSRFWAFAAALGYTLCSPSYDLFQAIDQDRGLLAIPWRWQVMVKYGEGPHNAGLTLLPVALLAVWNAMQGRRPRQIAIAAAALAVTALTHWIAALALALACLLLIAVNPWRRARPLIAAGLLGYLFAAFWLTPSFVKTVAFNWPKDSFGFEALTAQRAAAALIAAAVVAVWWLMRRMPDPYLRFVTLGFVLFAGICEAHYGGGVDPIPEARRYVLEMELFLALALAAWFRLAWQSRNGVNRFCSVLAAAMLLSGAMPQAVKFASSGYRQWTLIPASETVEYQLASWLAKQQPEGRVYVSGGLRFRLNSWFPLQQPLGTFDSGLQNRIPLTFDDWFRKTAMMRPGKEGEDSVRQLTRMGIEYVVIHGPKSEEYYRDTLKPDRFQGLLEPALNLGDDRIYRIPFQSLAHAVPAGYEQPWLHPVSLEALSGESARTPPMDAAWEGPSRLRIRGPVAPGSVVSVKVSYSPGWHAVQQGIELPIERDRMGFLRIPVRPAPNAEIMLDYRATSEQIVCALVSAAAVMAALRWSFLHRGAGNPRGHAGI